MNKNQSIWKPIYTINSAIVRALMDIESANTVVKNTPLSPAVEAELRYRARVVLSLFAKKDRITTQDAAFALGLSTRMVRILLKKWTEDKWLIVADSSNRGRSYVLSAIYWQWGKGSVQGVNGLRVQGKDEEFFLALPPRPIKPF